MEKFYVRGNRNHNGEIRKYFQNRTDNKSVNVYAFDRDDSLYYIDNDGKIKLVNDGSMMAEGLKAIAKEVTIGEIVRSSVVTVSGYTIDRHMVTLHNVCTDDADCVFPGDKLVESARAMSRISRLRVSAGNPYENPDGNSEGCHISADSDGNIFVVPGNDGHPMLRFADRKCAEAFIAVNRAVLERFFMIES